MKTPLLSFFIITLLFITAGCTKQTSTKSTTIETTRIETTTNTTLVTTETTEPNPYEKSLKVLAIGNSFSEDGMYQLYDIANNYGVEEIILGNLYIAGCSLETHWAKASTNQASYTYYKNTAGSWTEQKSVSMLTALKDEDWDIITLQQVSGKSGLVETYDPYLNDLINYVTRNRTNPYGKLAWHMTWAYEGFSTHKDFANYNNNQMEMFQAIVNTVQSRILTDERFDFIIPSGTAIQNVRTSYIGDSLTRDGYHLTLDLGRYIAAMTWFKELTGLPLDKIIYRPSRVTFDILDLVKESVNHAVEAPFIVTPSTFKPVDLNLNDYTLLELDTVLGYWNSQNPNNTFEINIEKADHINYVTQSVKLSKEQIPDGSVIVIDDGYQYRTNYWMYSNSPASLNTRSSITSTNQVIVNNAFWLGYRFVTFNINPKGEVQDLSNQIQEVGSHFRIYVPKINE